jgi:tetratricopeptide (TPR) repeat protein
MAPPSIDAAWDYADPSGSEARFREMIASAGAAADAGWRVEAHSQLARAVCLQRRYDDAHGILDAVEGLVPARGRPRVRWRLERGRILNDQGDAAAATAAFEEALALAEEAGEVPLAADAHHMLAYVARGEEGVARHRAAIAFCGRHAEGHPGLRRWLVTLHVNLADELERQERWPEALESVEAARAAAEATGAGKRAVGAAVFAARLHRRSGAVDRGWEVLEGVFDPSTADGWAWEERAEALLARGRGEEARAAFREAHARHAADPWFPPGEKARLERLRRLAEEVRPAAAVPATSSRRARRRARDGGPGRGRRGAPGSP